MKGSTTYGIIWLSCAIAASVGIIVTGSIYALLVFLIPASMSVEIKD